MGVGLFSAAFSACGEFELNSALVQRANACARIIPVFFLAKKQNPGFYFTVKNGVLRGRNPVLDDSPRHEKKSSS